MILNTDSLTGICKPAKSERFVLEPDIVDRAYDPPQQEKSFHWGLFFARLVVAGKNVKEHLVDKRNKNRLLRMTGNSVPLHSVAKGSSLVIVDIPEGQSRMRLIRLGIVKGEPIKCLERLAGGTVVIEKGRQEVAIGATLAKTILVAYIGADDLESKRRNA